MPDKQIRAEWYMQEFITQNQTAILLLALWILPWKGYALWIAARKNDVYWFVAILVLNTLAILDILYIFFFSKWKNNNPVSQSPSQPHMPPPPPEHIHLEKKNLIIIHKLSFMKPKDIFLGVVEAALWIFVTYYALYSIKNPVDVFQSAVIIVAFSYLACWACPMIRNSSGWRRMMGKEK